MAPTVSMDTLAEWLRRRPAEPMGSPRVGSNPTGVDGIACGRDEKGERKKKLFFRRAKKKENWILYFFAGCSKKETPMQQL